MGRQITWKDYLQALYNQVEEVRDAVVLGQERTQIHYAAFKKAVLREELCSSERKVQEYWRTLRDLEIVRMVNQSAALLELDEVRFAMGIPTLDEASAELQDDGLPGVV